MPFKFQCAHCGAPIKAPDTHAGQTLPCPKCGQPVLVMADPVPPPLPTVQPSVPPVASVQPAVAPPSVAVPPPAAVFVAAEEDDDAVIPEIVIRDAPTSATVPPALDFVGAAPPASEPYASPRTRRSRVSDVELQNVRVVDVRLSWGSMFWIVFQFYVCVLALSMVVGLAFLIFSMLLALVGVMATVSWLPVEWFVGM
jgi:DNA-directed RNA polymerase subunit RPC12/RpoP